MWTPVAPPVTPAARSLAMSVLLGLAVGSALLLGLHSGHTDRAGRAAMAMILVALPSIPGPPRGAARTLLTRSVTVVVAALAVAAVGGNEVVVAVGIVLAAALGFTVPSVGTTAALAILMSGLRMQTVPTALEAPGLWELIGALVVGAATVLTRLGQGAVHEEDLAERARERSWTVRRTGSVAAAVLLALVTPLGVYGGHWLVTAVLLSVRPTPSATRVRLAQRLLGNTVAALLVAVLMASGAGPTALAYVVAALTGLSFALRPVSYLWWAVAAPPVLLILGDYPTAHDWYEGMVRVALNVIGAIIVLIVCSNPRAREH
ncbi:FUSC family protein [Georgenia sp. H159]|uniref:FUSC family protein n=1 Tax=Georgenia sp. H159 TaxID=3076115 RepID=UPI002D769BD8|nr:FUSC family protein [Georgenia sp. H159]